MISIIDLELRMTLKVVIKAPAADVGELNGQCVAGRYSLWDNAPP